MNVWGQDPFVSHSAPRVFRRSAGIKPTLKTTAISIFSLNCSKETKNSSRKGYKHKAGFVKRLFIHV